MSTSSAAHIPRGVFWIFGVNFRNFAGGIGRLVGQSDWRAKQVSRDATKVGISYTGIWCQSLISSGAKMDSGAGFLQQKLG